MRARQCRMLLLSIAAALLSSQAGAITSLGNFNSIRETPITQFGKADMDLMTQTVYRTLDSGADGVTVKWDNPATESSGSITPDKDPQGRKGCRLAQIENRHKSLRSEGGYIFCKSDNKTKGPPWKLVSPWPV
ncbi:MAG TPA: hypothetical protein VGI11_12500 [Variovorax sp.]